VIAHRGASARYPENTLEAFEAAVADGADIVELDVRRSADGALVVMHDPTIPSVSHGHVPVAGLSLRDIKQLQPGIPAFDEVLDSLRGRVALEVEIKNGRDEPGYEPAGPGIARDVINALRRHAFTNAFVTSFDAECLRSVQEIDPEVPTGLLVDQSANLDDALETAASRHAFLLPEATSLKSAGRALIDRAHQREVRVCAWTLDDVAEIAALFRLGADGVETNDPVLGVAARDGLPRP